jgi:hypothetical protein
LEFKKVIGYPQVNGIVLFFGKKVETNFPRISFLKKRYESTFKYHEKAEEINQEIYTKKLKGMD